jgi:hypothetical protein
VIARGLIGDPGLEIRMGALRVIVLVILAVSLPLTTPRAPSTFSTLSPSSEVPAQVLFPTFYSAKTINSYPR